MYPATALIYYGVRINGAQDHEHARAASMVRLLKNYGTVLTDHIGDTARITNDNELRRQGLLNIAHRDLALANDATHFVADLNGPSTGLGFEIAYFSLVRRTPHICLYQQEQTPSLMIADLKIPGLRIKSYQNETDLERILNGFFAADHHKITRYPNYHVNDCLDGGGKDSMKEGVYKQWAKDNNLLCKDVVEFVKEHHRIPSWDELKSKEAPYKVLLVGEPTHGEVGNIVRGDILADKSGERYGTLTTAHAYALDRQILLERLIIPALKEGVVVISGRSVTTSEVYQPIQGEDEGFDPEVILGIVRGLPGNQLAHRVTPGLILLPQLDVYTAQSRMADRDKDRFEKSVLFQEKVARGFGTERVWDSYRRRGSRIARVELDPHAPKQINHAKIRAAWDEYVTAEKLL